MKITIEILELCKGAIEMKGRCKKDKKASEDVIRFTVMVCAAIRSLLPTVAEEFARKKAAELAAGVAGGKQKAKSRKQKSKGVRYEQN